MHAMLWRSLTCEVSHTSVVCQILTDAPLVNCGLLTEKKFWLARQLVHIPQHSRISCCTQALIGIIQPSFRHIASEIGDIHSFIQISIQILTGTLILILTLWLQVCSLKALYWRLSFLAAVPVFQPIEESHRMSLEYVTVSCSLYFGHNCSLSKIAALYFPA